MMRKACLALVCLLFVTPALVRALGLADVELSSALNQPLKAKIPLRGVQAGDLDTMQVGLGTREQFERAGLERPFVLTALRFKVVRDTGGRPHILVTTQDPVTEPFLNFLVEVNWPRGRVLREYTLLLDPPVYGAAIASTVKKTVPTVPPPKPLKAPEPAPQPPAPRPRTDTRAVPSVPTHRWAGEAGYEAPAPQPSPPAPTPTPTPTEYRPSAPLPTDSIDVHTGDTLWSLTQRYRPDYSLSTQQTMLAILRANPEAFFRDNINALRAGAVLRIPDAEEIESLTRAEALAEVKRQYASWQEFRQSMGATVAEAPVGTPEVVTGAPAEPAAKPVERLAILGPGAATQGVPGATEAEVDLTAVQKQLALSQEQLDSTQRENDELRSRLSETEALVKDLQRAVHLKDDQLAALQQKLGEMEAMSEAPMTMEEPTGEPTPDTMVEVEPPVTEPEPSEMPMTTGEAPPEPAPEVAMPEPKPAMAEPEPEPAPAVAEPEPRAKPQPLPTAPPEPVKPPLPPAEPAEPPSFLDSLPVPLPIILAGLGGILIIVGVVWFIRQRRAGDGGKSEEALFEDAEPTVFAGSEETTDVPVADEAEAITEAPPAAAAVEEAEEAPEEVPAEPESEPTAPVEPEEDPLAEVNVYLAYERFDQAEELVKDAIGKYPDRHDYKLKLLEIFYAAKDMPNFEEHAKVLEEAVGADSSLMTTARGWWADLSPGRELFAPPGEMPAELSETKVRAPGELFDVTGAEEPSAITEPGGLAEGTAVDFDLGFEGEVQPEQADSEVDFDLGPEEVGSQTAVDLDFTVESAPDGTPAGEDSVVDFDLGMMEEPEAGAPAAAPEETEAGGDLDFDLGFEETVVPAEEAPAAPEQEPAAEGAEEAMDLDFGLPAEGEPAPAQPAAEEAAGEESVELDFDLGAEVATEEGDEDVETVRLKGSTPPEAGLESTEEGIDLDLSEPAAAEALDIGLPEPETGAAEIEAGEISLDLPSEEGLDVEFPAPAAAGEEAPEAELDVESVEIEAPAEEGLDIELGAEPSEVGELALGGPDEGVSLDELGAQAEDVLDLGLPEAPAEEPEISLDLGEEEAPVAAEPSAAEEISLDLGELEAEAGAEAPALDIGAELETGETPPEDEGFSLDIDTGEADEDAPGGAETTQFMLRDVPETPVDDEAQEDEDNKTLVLGRDGGGDIDEIQTKLDLAQAYVDMGDTEGARGILGEVLAEGTEAHQAAAKELLAKLS